MAINLLTAITPVAPASLADYVAQNDKIETSYLNGQNKIPFASDLILQGSVFNIGGSIYRADSDTAITGVASDYVKITPAGATASAAYVTDLTGVTWNQAYNGYYDIGGNLYIFDEGKAMYAGEIAAVVGRYVMQQRTGDVYVPRDAYVKRDLAVGDDLAVTDDLTVGDDAAVGGKLTVTETLGVTGAATVGGTLGVTGALTAPSIYTSNAHVKMKKFSGTLNASGVAQFAHGLTYSKIISLSIAARFGTYFYYVYEDTLQAGFDQTEIRIEGSNANYANKDYKCIVFYEA